LDLNSTSYSSSEIESCGAEADDELEGGPLEAEWKLSLDTVAMVAGEVDRQLLELGCHVEYDQHLHHHDHHQATAEEVNGEEVESWSRLLKMTQRDAQYFCC
jgi:hypothetical protein